MSNEQNSNVEMELSKIIISETSEQQAIVLKEKGGTRSFPIIIGFFEVLAIDRKIKGIEIPRPMTHDLLENIIEEMGGRLTRIIVNDIEDHTFYARLIITQGEKELDIDARPSDAIALAIRSGVPIFASERVLSQVSI